MVPRGRPTGALTVRFCFFKLTWICRRYKSQAKKYSVKPVQTCASDWMFPSCALDRFPRSVFRQKQIEQNIMFIYFCCLLINGKESRQWRRIHKKTELALNCWLRGILVWNGLYLDINSKLNWQWICESRKKLPCGRWVLFFKAERICHRGEF